MAAAGAFPKRFESVEALEEFMTAPDAELVRDLAGVPGDIMLLGDQFRIVGITDYSSVINRNAVIIGLADLQELTFRNGAVTYISVKLAPPGGEAEADREIEQLRRESTAAGADWQFVNYAGAVHCFAEPDQNSPPGCVYNQRAADRAFRLMNGFFDERFAAAQ